MIFLPLCTGVYTPHVQRNTYIFINYLFKNCEVIFPLYKADLYVIRGNFEIPPKIPTNIMETSLLMNIRHRRKLQYKLHSAVTVINLYTTTLNIFMTYKNVIFIYRTNNLAFYKQMKLYFMVVFLFRVVEPC